MPGVLVDEFGWVADVEIELLHLLRLLGARLGWVAKVAEFASQAVAWYTADALQLELLQAIESGLEIVENDSVCKALEGESQFPEGIDSIGESRAFDDVSDGEYVDDNEGNADDHCCQ